MTRRPTWLPRDILRSGPAAAPPSVPAALASAPEPRPGETAPATCPHCRASLDLEAIYAQAAADRAARLVALMPMRPSPPAAPVIARRAPEPPTAPATYVAPPAEPVAPLESAPAAPHPVAAPAAAPRPRDDGLRRAAARERDARAEARQAAAALADARPGPGPAASTKGARAVDRIERQALDAPAPARPRPVATVQAPLHRGRVASDFPNADLLLAAPGPGGRAARCFAELLRRRAAGAAPPADWALEHEGASADDEARRLRRVVAVQDLGALASLYDVCPTLYPLVSVPPSDGLPINGDALRAAIVRAGGSSPALACLES